MRYLVDTNALSQLRRQRRASKFFRAYAMIPSEVLHEAEGFPDVEALTQIEYYTTASVLRWLMTVMATVPPDDTDLINLYLNQGSADPLMVACALDALDRERQHLDPLEWAVVTDDKAVMAKANEFKVRVLTYAQFADLIDGSEPT
jgi:flavin-binding protein dodecin